MPYSHTTFIELRSLLFHRLSGSVFWPDTTELPVYLKEALRVWGALALRWRKRVTFALEEDVAWYDLTSKVPDLAPTIKDQDLVAEIQMHLLEQVDGTTWRQTEQFGGTEPKDQLEMRRDQFLSETGLILSRDTPSTISMGADGRVDLSAVTALKEVIDIRRLVWRTAAGTRKNLWVTDEWGAHSFRPEWNLEPQETPDAYSRAITTPLEIQLIPRPSAPGLLEYITIKPGAALNIASGVVLGIPDALCWIIKYAALEDMLGKDGPGRDSGRAAYCRMRYEQGVQVASIYPMAIEAEINGRRQPISNVQEWDAYDPDWESRASGTPERCALMGLNLLAVTPPPDSNAHSLTLDILQPAPIPLTDGTNLQLGKDELDAILDYAVHIASFKSGANELEQTQMHFDHMVKLATVHNEKLRVKVRNFEAMHQRAQEEVRRRPVRTVMEG